MKSKGNTSITRKIQLFKHQLLRSLGLLRSKYFIFLFFLLLSTLAWFLRALNDTYVADLYFPVKYSNLPSNRILLNEPPKKIVLKVRADGFTILANKLRLKRSINYNINAFSLYALSIDSTSVYQLTKYSREKLTDELSYSFKNITILDIDPDTLFFNFAKVVVRKIKIQPQISSKESLFAKQHLQNGPIVAMPDSLLVTGPSSILDTLRFFPTETIELNNISDTIKKSVKLTALSRLSVKIKKVIITIPVDRFTESELVVPVVAINVPDSILVKTFPKMVRINYLITLSNFSKVSTDMFHPQIDYLQIDPKNTDRLPILLDSLPQYIHDIKMSPKDVDYLIEIKRE